MTNRPNSMRILLISQWPNVKNGEYELIEKIKRTGHDMVVVDYFGFNVDSGVCLDKADLHLDYDFAISLHYDTPKFLNLPTLLWVANPLEFMHLRGDYSSVLLHHLRAYDGYLFNGSDTLKAHIKNVLGSEWHDAGLEMFPSCSMSELIPPKTTDQQGTQAAHKVFYCGVNWEKGTDQTSRAQGLLDILQDNDAADFYGPNKLEGISPWAGFKSYKGEIPFDGVSMSKVMQQYGAVLAVSSPAHMRSRTSSSRVFEGVAAGVPVISDENPHVKKLFGDSVYYFNGSDETEKARSILTCLQQINENPEDAAGRVNKAQTLMVQRFCFEPCFDQMLSHLAVVKADNLYDALAGKCLDIFLLCHEEDAEAPDRCTDFQNANHLLAAASYAAKHYGIQVRITTCGGYINAEQWQLPVNVTLQYYDPEELTGLPWRKLRLGEKIALMGDRAEGDFVNFLTQFDFPLYDFYAKGLEWFAGDSEKRSDSLFIGGFFVSDLQQKADLGTVGIVRNNTPKSMYRWTQNSLAEHQTATLIFAGKSRNLLAADQIDRFDMLLPISVIAATATQEIPYYRSRHILVRAQVGSFHRHYQSYQKTTEKGFWAQHYELVTNYNHEINALYDVHHGSSHACAIADQVSGKVLPPPPLVDPAVYVVNNFISRLKPVYRLYKKFRKAVRA